MTSFPDVKPGEIVPTVRYAEAAEQRWRNGRGVTRELFRDERWRLSVATIATPGPFSVFPGLDRVFVVGRGVVELTVDGQRHRLTAGEMLGFTGEAAVSAVPQGAVTAVNVMTHRPGRARVRFGTWPESRAVAVVDPATGDAWLDVPGPDGPDGPDVPVIGPVVVVEEIS
nr:HutD family protein [Kineosporia rhizophila]